MNTILRERIAGGFYWLGVVTTVASIASVLFGNSAAVAPFEHTGFPIAWKFALVAVASYFARVICLPRQLHRTTKAPDSRQSLEHLPYEI